jgi:alkane 1-monooxygenase
MNVIKKLGFFSAFILPLLLILGFEYGGLGIFAIHIFSFIAVPLLDLLISKDKQNIDSDNISIVSKESYYHLVLYSWVFVQLGVLLWAFVQVSFQTFSALEYLGLATGTALVTGGIGITVAHELGHKKGQLDQGMAKILLMMVCYMHFLIEHNRGHHVRVATLDDPASSRYNENFYAFWWRSVKEGYFSAWQLEKERLNKKGLAFWSFDNQMINFLLAPLLFIGVITIFFLWIESPYVGQVVLFFFVQSFFAFSLLEIVNYIEHYGMERKLLDNGRYERVNPLHSWNASQRISNFLLFQLQRHSDHHAFAHKPFQVLNHYEESPQLPAGYSAMIILALFPPLWFSIMNPILNNWKSKSLPSPQVS